MQWTQQQYEDYQNRRASSRAQLEQAVCHEPVGEAKGEAAHAGGITVRIKSYRKRPLDPDNLCGGAKYFLDGIKYAGLIPDDRPQDIALEVTQEKVKLSTDERTEIEITYDTRREES